jgi:hypothetical protein
VARLLLAGLVVALLHVPHASITSADSTTVAGISRSARVGHAPSTLAASPKRNLPIAPKYLADFETGNFSQVFSQQEVRHEAITLTSASPMQGDHMVSVNAGPADVGSGNVRAEIVFERLADRFAGGGSLEGKSTWVTWEQRLDRSFEIASWCILTQFLGGAGSGWPMFAIEANGPAPGKLYAVVRGGQVSVNARARVVLASPVPLGTPMKFRIHHRWSTGSSGRVRVWLNGVLKATIRGPNLFTGHERTPYHKGGIYRAGRAVTRDSQAWIDNVRWWQ